jgi:hypothetical protein
MKSLEILIFALAFALASAGAALAGLSGGPI